MTFKKNKKNRSTDLKQDEAQSRIRINIRIFIVPVYVYKEMCLTVHSK